MQTSPYRIAIIAVIVVFAVIIAGKLSPERKTAPDADAKAYTDAAVVAICTNWDRDQLIARASPELAGAIQVTGPDAFFGKLTARGRLTKYEGAVG
jgi:anti-sigma-K factor RskA